MYPLSSFQAQTIFAGTQTTTTTEDGSKWVCTCSCENPKIQALYEQEDDPWIWWIISWPFNFVINAFR